MPPSQSRCQQTNTNRSHPHPGRQNHQYVFNLYTLFPKTTTEKSTTSNLLSNISCLKANQPIKAHYPEPRTKQVSYHGDRNKATKNKPLPPEQDPQFNRSSNTKITNLEPLNHTGERLRGLTGRSPSPAKPDPPSPGEPKHYSS